MREKIVTILLIIALTGCSLRDETDNILSTKELRFTTLNDKTTRAATSKGDDYKVLARYAGRPTWFINTTFNGGGTDADKPKDGSVYYWPGTGTLDFWAYAPASVDATLDYAGASALINYSVNAKADEDFTVASPLINKSLADGVVAFKFKHVLSRATIRAELSEELRSAGFSITFNSAELTVNSTGGKMDIMNGSQTWTEQNKTSAVYSGEKTYMFMPQSGKNVAIQLKGVSITKNGIVITDVQDMNKYILSGTASDIENFEKGVSYNITMTVSGASTGSDGNAIMGSQIEFSVDSEPWNDEEHTIITDTDNMLFFAADGTLEVGKFATTGGPMSANEFAYFKYGSVIGMRSSFYKIGFNPSNYLTFNNYAAIHTYSAADYQKFDAAPINEKWRFYLSGPEYHNAANIALGKGDPCKLAGLSIEEIKAGNIDNGIWRMPTQDEQKLIASTAILGNCLDTGRGANWNGILLGAKTGFLPNTGHVTYVGTVLSELSTTAYFWSSIPVRDGSYGAAMAADRYTIYPDYDQFNKEVGFTIRCVRQ